MPIEGFLDQTSTHSITGWLYATNDPDKAIAVDIVADGETIATVIADGLRHDLEAAGKGNGRHAFTFALPEGRTATTPLRARPAGKRWFLPLADSAYPHLYASFKHPCEYGLPDVSFGFSPMPQPDPAQEIPLAKRLLAAYQKAEGKTRRDGKREDGWTHTEDVIFGDYLAILRKGDAEALAVYMRDFYAQTVNHGTYQGKQATVALESGNGGTVAALFQDTLASLAEYLGVVRVEDPNQQGHYGDNLYRDPDELVDLIHAKLGIEVVPPAVAGRKFGLQTKNGILHGVDIRSLHAAHRIRELIGNAENPSVCEIGGGIGSAAYFCYQLGVRDVEIIDLPTISLMQAYYLIRALPEANVVLYGERDPGGPGIRLLPPSSFGRRKFDLVYNQDSFPEMHRDNVVAYLQGTRKIAPALLSINQEAEGQQTKTSVQLVVHEVVAAVGGFQRLYRFPHWIRQGYVEELYAVTPLPAASRWQSMLRLLGRS